MLQRGGLQTQKYGPLGHVLPMERKCRRVLHEADPRDLPAKNVILGERKRTNPIYIYLHNPSMCVFSYYFTCSLCRSWLPTTINHSRKLLAQKRVFRYIFQGLSLITRSQHAECGSNTSMGSRTPKLNQFFGYRAPRCYQLPPR
jgi:hypothetical protein